MIRAGLCLALACAACVRYEPRPLDPATHPAELARRDLGDSALVAAVTRYAGRPQADRWTDRQLALAALTLRSDLRRLRAERRAALAAGRTAGERPGIGLQGDVERRVGGRDEAGPWVVGIAGLVQVELGGKRGARQQAALAGLVLAESRLVATARTVAAETRLAAAALARALADAEDAKEELRALEDVHRLERARFAESALGASELARTSSDIQDARLSVAQAGHAVLTARAGLAAAVALPVRSLESLVPVVDPPSGCAALETTEPAAFGAAAVRRRPEIAVALSEYAVSESRLRLEVSRQFPDLELGPGFVWDQGVDRWALALALPALLGSRNRGAIAEAEVAREVAALRVAEVQDSILADLDMAVERCRGASLEVAAADSVVAAAQRLARRERDAYRRGETSGLEPARAQLQLLRAKRARRVAGRLLSLASLDLERAAGGPPSAEGSWPDPREESDLEAEHP
ncbi:MAG TPA: TolC family protein [Gemmatimonadales bacterium]